VRDSASHRVCLLTALTVVCSAPRHNTIVKSNAIWPNLAPTNRRALIAPLIASHAGRRRRDDRFRGREIGEKVDSDLLVTISSRLRAYHQSLARLSLVPETERPLDLCLCSIRDRSVNVRSLYLPASRRRRAHRGDSIPPNSQGVAIVCTISPLPFVAARSGALLSARDIASRGDPCRVCVRARVRVLLISIGSGHARYRVRSRLQLTGRDCHVRRSADAEFRLSKGSRILFPPPSPPPPARPSIRDSRRSSGSIRGGERPRPYPRRDFIPPPSPLYLPPGEIQGGTS